MKHNYELHDNVYPFPTSNFLSHEQAIKICNGELKINVFNKYNFTLEKI